MEPHTRLKSWLEAANVTQAELARRCGYDRHNMSKIVKGLLRPTLDLAFKLERVTSGTIPASAWAQDTAAQGEAA